MNLSEVGHNGAYKRAHEYSESEISTNFSVIQHLKGQKIRITFVVKEWLRSLFLFNLFDKDGHLRRVKLLRFVNRKIQEKHREGANFPKSKHSQNLFGCLEFAHINHDESTLIGVLRGLRSLHTPPGYPEHLVSDDSQSDREDKVGLEVQKLIYNRFFGYQKACLFRLASVVRFLLIASGIELNPGPPKIITVNCRGLSSRLKMLSTIGKLRKECEKNDSCIIFLQETHLEDAQLISDIWEGSIVMNSFYSSSQRGVVTILKGQFKINKHVSDQEGRYSIANVTHDLFQDDSGNNSLTLVNIYAPNNHMESLVFFKNIFNKIEELNSEIAGIAVRTPDLIIAGDFNFVFDEFIDCQNRKVLNDERSLARFVSEKFYELELWDLVQSSSNSTNFTWRRESTRSRLDYIIASGNIASKVKRYSHKWQLVKTDHAAVIVELTNSLETSTGRSYPKLSFNDIKDPVDKNYIREVIINAKKDFLVDWCPHTRLEYVKLMIRSSVLRIRSSRNKEISQLDALKEEVNTLEKFSTLNSNEINRLTDLKIKIDKTEEMIEEQLKLKSGIKWREEGERSSKFFLNLINSKIRVGAAHKGFIDAGGNLILNNADIVNHAKDFYSNLYSGKPVTADQQFYAHCPSLDGDEHDQVGAPVTIMELKAALKTCKDSTPGLDGIPYWFYKIFHDLLLPLVLDSWNFGLKVGKLAPSHRQSCITIIPKAGKDTRLIRNWRPITVASCDLKVITKALSIRMAKVAPSIIYDTQMAYVPGRDINFNNRILSYIIENIDNNEDVIVSFDAEKAFDSVSHKYLKDTLLKYNFPETFIQFFSLIYSENSSVVQVNGHLSDPFELKRGVKQGDALSCLLFVLAIDPLIRNIEANNLINPIYVKAQDKFVSVKTLAYADDIAVVTKNNGSINEVFKEYERLYEASGLKLNADKTEILVLSERDLQTFSATVSYLEKRIPLVATTTVKICGNHLTKNVKERYKLNIATKIDSLNKVLLNWSRRNLTPNGKMMIIKCHALSQLTFVNQFQNISPSNIKQIELICYKFLWNGGPERVKRSTLKLNKLEGGINGIDIDSFLSATKIRQFFKAEKYCKALQFIQRYCSVGDEITRLVKNCMSKLFKCNWKNIDISHLDDNGQSLLANCDLRSFFKAGSKMDNLLLNLNPEKMCFNDIMKLGRGTVNKIIRGLPSIFKHLLRKEYPSVNTTPVLMISDKVKTIVSLSSRSLQEILKEQSGKSSKFLLTSKYDNLSVGELETKQCWFNLWRIRNPTLRNYRLKVLYKDVYCQERRFRFGLTNSPRCTICNEIETVQHQLFDCKNAKRMWQIYNNIFKETINFKTAIIVKSNDASELAKAVILKLLVQIDRSMFVSTHYICLQIKQVLKLETLITNNKRHENVIRDIEGLLLLTG